MLLEIFCNFITKHLPDKFSLQKLLNIMDFILNCCPQLSDDLVGQINRNIELIEKTRNIGSDFILRFNNINTLV